MNDHGSACSAMEQPAAEVVVLVPEEERLVGEDDVAQPEEEGDPAHHRPPGEATAHPDQRFSMIADANSEVLRTRAPSIWRSKS